jgi:hypothetical protein
VRLTSQQIVTRRRTRSFDLHATHGDRVVIPLHGPGDIHNAPAGGADHEPRGIGIGFCGPRAAAARISEIAVTPQRLRFDDSRSGSRALTAVKIAERRGNRNQLPQR